MKNVPNILSTIRILLAPVFLYLFLQDSLVLGLLGVLVFTIAAITDFFDGHLARKHNIESHFGVFLDPLADKVLTFGAFIVLPFVNEEQFPWWAVWVIIGRDLAITLLRIYTKRRHVMMKTRKTAKAKTTIQLVFLYIALLVSVFAGKGYMLSEYADHIMQSGILYYLFLFTAGFTLYSGLEYLYVNRQVFRKQAV